jgi:hypothetical protein
MLMVDRPQKGNEKLTGLASSIVATIVTDPPTPGQYDVQMVKGTKVFGKLTYADGKVAAKKDVSVSAYGFGREGITTRRDKNSRSSVVASMSQQTTADENGEYAIYLAPGDYDIRQSDGGFSEKHQKPIVIKEGMDAVRFDFTVPPPTEGTICMPDGSPAVNLKIEYTSIVDTDPAPNINGGYSTTDENGNFSIILGEYANMICIKTADGKYGIVKYLEGKERLAPQTWTLHEACVGKVRIVDGRTGKPIAGHKLHSNVLLRFGNNGSYGAGPLTAVSDEEGNVELKPLFPAGEYRLVFDSPPGARGYPALDVSFFPQKSGETIDLGTHEVEDFEWRAKVSATE